MKYIFKKLSNRSKSKNRSVDSNALENRGLHLSDTQVPLDFNDYHYLLLNPDVKEQNLDPRIHYSLFGRSEGRTYKFGEFIDGKIELDYQKPTCLFVVHDLALTGSPLLALAVIKQLNKVVNVVVLSFVEDGILKEAYLEESVSVFCTLTSITDTEVSIGIVESIIGKFKVDYSIVNSASSNSILSGLKAKAIPTVTLVHEFAQTAPDKYVANCIELSTICIFSTEATYEAALMEINKTPTSEIFIQPQGKIPHNEVFENLNSDSLERKKIDRVLDTEKIKVLGVGSLLITKGVDLFLQVAVEVEKISPNRYQFIWVGPEIDLFEKKYGVFIKEFISKSKHLSNFVFYPQTTELSYLMENVDLFALTSRLDTFPNVAIEALCLGKPLISFEKTGGIPKYLESFELTSNCVAEYLDISSFAQKIIDFENNNELKLKFSSEIKAKANLDFDMNIYAKKLIEYCNQAQKLVSAINE